MFAAVRFLHSSVSSSAVMPGGIPAAGPSAADRNADGPGDLAVMAAIISIAALLELAMGRPPTYTKGPVRLLVRLIFEADQNSRQVADPCTGDPCRPRRSVLPG